LLEIHPFFLTHPVYKIKATITTKKALEYKPMRWTNCVKSKEGVENQLKHFRTRQRRVM
jgi:hypothetical protein